MRCDRCRGSDIYSSAWRRIMTWPLGLVDSAWANSTLSRAETMRLTREVGFETLDLFIGYDPGALGRDERDTLRSDIRSSGLEIWALLCATFGLSDFNDSVRAYNVERAKRVVELASEVGARTVLVAPGEYAFQQQLFDPDFEWQRVVGAVREIGEAAARHDLNLSVELLPFEFAFINSVETLVCLLDAVALENVTAAIDISHFWLRRIDPSEITKLRGRIGQVHLADCDGVHHGDLPVGLGNTPFSDYLRVLDEVQYAGSASVELEFAPDGEDMVVWVRSAHAGSLSALEAAGLR
jgi:D-psicose/D-tagatose/L-ribulose 3-epimerase